MATMASQITSLFIVYSTVYSGADQRKYQSSASMACVRGIHRGPVNSTHKGPVTLKMFTFDDVIVHNIPSIRAQRIHVRLRLDAEMSSAKLRSFPYTLFVPSFDHFLCLIESMYIYFTGEGTTDIYITVIRLLRWLRPYYHTGEYNTLTHLGLSLFCRSPPGPIREIEVFATHICVTREMRAVFHDAYMRHQAEMS